MWLLELAGSKHQGCQIHVYFPRSYTDFQRHLHSSGLFAGLIAETRGKQNSRGPQSLPSDLVRNWMTSTRQSPTQEARKSPSSSPIPVRCGDTTSTYTSWSRQQSTGKSQHSSTTRAPLRYKGGLRALGLFTWHFVAFPGDSFGLELPGERAGKESETEGLDPEAVGWEAFRATSQDWKLVCLHCRREKGEEFTFTSVHQVL